MYCLLCHEKIPRLRAWRTKSEFCSDEHAAQYKKQTLDRLLTDQNPAHKEKPTPIAVAEDEQDPFFHDEMAIGPEAEPETLPVETPEPETPSIFSEAQAAEMESFNLPGEDDDLSFDSQDGVEELWRMAEQVDHSGGHSDSGEIHDTHPQAARQSAEEALQALRMLASKGSQKAADLDAAGQSEHPTSSDEDDFSFSDIEDLPPIGDDLMAELEGGFSALDDNEDKDQVDALQAREETQPEDRQRPHSSAGDEETPSILERLMEDPVTDWRQPSSAERPSAAAPDPLEDLPDALADFDEFPEPEFAFQEEAIEAKASETDETPEEVVEAKEPTGVEALDEASLEDIEALLADDHDDPEIDPLAELIKAEEAAQAKTELDDADDLELDDAVADQLVNELAEEAFRDDLDLQELERSLKVVPFPTPDHEPSKNGHRSNADELLAKAADVLDPDSDSADEENESVESASKKSTRRSLPRRPGRTRTKFKPSMIMAGIEPSLQGYLQGDPLESWRGQAVKSAWGDGGAPDAHSYEISPIHHAAGEDSQLQAIGPERLYRARMGVPVTLCTPAQAQDVNPPTLDWTPQRPDTTQQSPRPLATGEEAWIRLGPEYRAFEDAIFVDISTQDDVAQEVPHAMAESAGGLQMLLAPNGQFYDSVSLEERFVDEEDWEDSVVSLGDPSEGIDLSEDFASEQPATQSSGGRRGR